MRCALKVQQRLPVLDSDQPPDQAIRFRVGINIGDAIVDGTDLHGDRRGDVRDNSHHAERIAVEWPALQSLPEQRTCTMRKPSSPSRPGVVLLSRRCSTSWPSSRRAAVTNGDILAPLCLGAGT